MALHIEPKCPKCDRLTVDNKQHCTEKTSVQWMKNCLWMRCVGLVDGNKRRCNWIYGPLGWAGYQGGNA